MFSYEPYLFTRTMDLEYCMNITRNGFRAFSFIILDLCIVYGFTRFGSLSMLTIKEFLVERV